MLSLSYYSGHTTVQVNSLVSACLLKTPILVHIYAPGNLEHIEVSSNTNPDYRTRLSVQFTANIGSESLVSNDPPIAKSQL